ncbi:AMP-binding protein [Corallococcus interemptor]|uniref:AMP-binding protein n=1 Tax=Corallococcus interemptor TaxID=2316720 RepID=UPI003CFD3EF3
MKTPTAPETLRERLEHHGRSQGQQWALRFPAQGGETLELTWAELVERARGIGLGLKRRGVTPKDVVVIVSSSPREQALSFLGALFAEAVPSVYSHPSIKQPAERFFASFSPLISNSGAACLLYSDALAPAFQEWRDASGSGIALFPLRELLEEPAGDEPLPASDSKVAFLQFSSGTTGLRKGVAITHAMLASQVRAYAEAIHLSPSDRVVSWLPLYHDMGLVACLLLPCFMGVPSVHLSPFDWVQRPQSLWRAIADSAGTLVWLPNFAFELLAQRTRAEDLGAMELGRVRAFINCSEPVRPVTLARFVERMGPYGVRWDQLQGSYGMAENTFAVTQTPMGSPLRLDRVRRAPLLTGGETVALGDSPQSAEDKVFASSGLPIAGCEVRISHRGERRIGEIEIRSPSLFEGYVANPEATAVSRTEDGWFRTGDLGYLAEGELFVTGRLKDLIIHRGTNLYPEDIEEVVASVPGCKAGRVVAFGITSEQMGTEEVVVCVEPEPDLEDPRALAIRIRQEVALRLSLGLKDVALCEPGSLLKSTSGKPSRSGNREAYASGRLRSPHPPGSADRQRDR